MHFYYESKNKVNEPRLPATVAASASENGRRRASASLFLARFQLSNFLKIFSQSGFVVREVVLLRARP